MLSTTLATLNKKQTAVTCLSIRIILVSSSISNYSSLSGAWLSSLTVLNDVSNDNLLTHWTCFMKIMQLAADQEEDTPFCRWHGILSLKAGLQPFPWSDLRKSLSWTSLWWNTFKILLLNCWSLTITRHLAMIPIVQKLVWWSFEIRPTPHKTKHEIWNQKNENVIFVTASWCITRVSDTSITCHWQELKRCRKYWLMPFILIPWKIIITCLGQ